MIKKLILPATALLLCMFVFFNCNKDFHNNQAAKTDKVGFSISEAQSWYSNHSTQQPNSELSKGTTRKIGAFYPKWDKAFSSSDKKYEIVECPIRFDNKPGFTISKKGDSNNTIHGSTRLLILKSKKDGSIRSALMNIYSTSGDSDSTITYSKRGNHFSGYIFFTDINGEFINGWKYEDGRIIKQSKKTFLSANTASKALPPPDEDCETIETRWYEQDCNYYTDGSSECTDWYYLGSTYETYCTNGGGGGGGGSNGEYEHIVYGEETFNTGRSVIYPGGQHTIGVTYYTKVQYTYDYDSQTFLDITPFQPTASPQSQFFWDDNGNLATLTVTCFPWSFSSTPLTNKSFFAVWDFVATWLFSYTTGNIPLTFTEGASRVVAVP